MALFFHVLDEIRFSVMVCFCLHVMYHEIGASEHIGVVIHLSIFTKHAPYCERVAF